MRLHATLISAIAAALLCGCAGRSELAARFPQSGSSIDWKWTGTVFSKTEHFNYDSKTGRLTMTKPDNSPILSALAWGTAAGAAGKALDGVASEAVSKIGD